MPEVGDLRRIRDGGPDCGELADGHSRAFMADSAPVHVSVLLDEVVEWLQSPPGATIVDGTLGGGGHARALAERMGGAGLVIGLDRDP